MRKRIQPKKGKSMIDHQKGNKVDQKKEKELPASQKTGPSDRSSVSSEKVRVRNNWMGRFLSNTGKREQGQFCGIASVCSRGDKGECSRAAHGAVVVRPKNQAMG